MELWKERVNLGQNEYKAFSTSQHPEQPQYINNLYIVNIDECEDQNL